MIYLDNAATTRTAPEVVEAMFPFFSENYGNASSIYGLGSTSKKALNHARRTLAEALGARQEEIYFTAGGSEADNWALKAAAEAYGDRGKHIVTTRIEHHAVLHTCEYLEKQGYEVTYVGVDENGVVGLEELEAAIRPDTILISVMYANNEVGTLQPIREIGQIAHFTDPLNEIIPQLRLPFDLLRHNAHGPLYRFSKAHDAGNILRSRPAGTLLGTTVDKTAQLYTGADIQASHPLGTVYLVGAGAEHVNMQFVHPDGQLSEHLPEKIKRETQLRDYLIERICEKIPYCHLNGDRDRRLPGNVNFSFRFVEGESVLIMLDMKGICASSGSACTSGALDPSHVLLAMGLSHELAHGSLRMTLSEENTEEEMDTVVDALVEIIGKLRAMSPLYEDFIKSRTGEEHVQ